jgi:hypothetical protein
MAMALRLCIRHVGLGRYCGPVRHQHTKIRKELIPLIKFLHPDLLGHCSEAVRKQNMTCIQNLNDMWDTLEANVESLAGKPLSYGLDVRHPFRPTYDLTCYLKLQKAPDEKALPKEGAKDGSANEAAMRKTPFIIRVPDDVCKKQSISQRTFSDAIDRVLIQQGHLFVHAGLDNPWESVAAKEAREQNQTQQIHDRGGKKSVLSPELERHLFERWYAKNKLQSDIERGGPGHDGRSSMSHMFSTVHDSRNLMKKLDFTFGNPHLAINGYENEVDAYIKVSVAVLCGVVCFSRDCSCVTARAGCNVFYGFASVASRSLFISVLWIYITVWSLYYQFLCCPFYWYREATCSYPIWTPTTSTLPYARRAAL